jgi:cation/acetate symporter
VPPFGAGGFISNPVDSVSLGLALLMFGTAGLPHILMRFYTVPNSMTVGNSVSYTVFFIGYFHLAFIRARVRCDG